jgi:predicted DNA-binding ribbon-helix-helix protein
MRYETSLETYSVKVAGRWTSVKLEPELMDALEEVARAEGRTVDETCDCVAAARRKGSLTSALRLHVMQHYRQRIARQTRFGPHGYLFDDPLFRALRELGLALRIEFDIEDWKSFIRSTEWPVINSAADPAYHEFAAGEVFWMRLVHGEETVATQLVRLIVTDDYVGMIRDHRLFFRQNPSGFRSFRMLVEDGLPRIGGIVAQLSGLYIRPQWRRTRTTDGTRLVAAWARLTHSFTTRNLLADWSVSLLEERIATPRMIEELYGYPHAIELFETYIPYLDRDERVTMVWMSAKELAVAVVRRPRALGRIEPRQPAPVEASPAWPRRAAGVPPPAVARAGRDAHAAAANADPAAS